ncbi:MAG: hypothetical protein DI596_12330 [Azospira oryzae]|uniref:Uncharacterized protein n=1 Tax=Pelomicrobium methylotrophicum TaxID=2602750 RepID=A0A5C7EKT6_9PROT|nr:hypothetical protein [Pelomicrobium methylotrophicum]PZP54799.1 MAG: hypothetical protein DI596_12330 [Azospira oryzae]PZP77517.1 MAG: hypothetical protein DI593_12330 [Azospira oryzae]TXF12099.1 hypothetical protein FR698_07585 [Pelomicrobium methylotrophicum]GIX27133.1 MAG: hypothetical protein KatS3mg123_1014 [Burkholderiales bacterium]
MKQINLTDISRLKNELNKYRKGKKLDIVHFNQAARLAWLGRIVLCPLDPEDPDCEAYLLYLPPPDELTARVLTLDEVDQNGHPFLGQIHVLDGEQGRHLADIFREGMEARVKALQALEQRDFYFACFFKTCPEGSAGEQQ